MRISDWSSDVCSSDLYVSWDDFSERASAEEIAGFVRAVGEVARDQGLVAPGYRLLANAGLDSHQEIAHLHVHIFADRKSVVSGQSGSVRVDPGGRRILTKNKNAQTKY